MNTTVETLIHLGKDLTQEELRVINAHRKLEFHSASDIAPNPDDVNWEKIFVLIKLESDLVAFGRLHDIEIEFKGKIYDVFGIATIIAVRKGHGYGTMVMKAIEQYVIKSGKTAIGFCTPNVSDFYRKCGYGIIKGGIQRFVFIDNGEPAKIEHPDDYALYLPGNDNLMSLMELHPEKKPRVHRKPWKLSLYTIPMQKVQKAGGIVVNDKNEILVITNQIGKTTLPKGGQEVGETLEQTATREVLEEGGLTKVRLVKKLGVIERPGYTADNFATPSVIKQIHMFLFQADDSVLIPEVIDVVIAQWMTIDNALKVLSWEEEKAFLEQTRHEVL